jgi:hypothetical protein
MTVTTIRYGVWGAIGIGIVRSSQSVLGRGLFLQQFKRQSRGDKTLESAGCCCCWEENRKIF